MYVYVYPHEYMDVHVFMQMWICKSQSQSKVEWVVSLRLMILRRKAIQAQ